MRTCASSFASLLSFVSASRTNQTLEQQFAEDSRNAQKQICKTSCDGTESRAPLKQTLNNVNTHAHKEIVAIDILGSAPTKPFYLSDTRFISLIITFYGNSKILSTGNGFPLRFTTILSVSCFFFPIIAIGDVL